MQTQLYYTKTYKYKHRYTRMETMAYKIINRKYVCQYYQDGLQQNRRLYEVNQHTTVNIDITFKNVFIQL